MTQNLVLTEMHGAVALITLNRPQAMNALSHDLLAQLVAALVRAQADPQVRAVVLTGAGERAFTAGLDLKEISADPAVLQKAVTAGSPTNAVDAIGRMSCPVIAAVNGHAITGGLELMLACDMAIAAQTAKFADTHAAVGIIPGWGLSQRLSRLIGIARAKQMHFSARAIDATTAQKWGLVNSVVAQSDLMETALDLAQSMAAHDPDAVMQIKALVDDGAALPFGQAMALETDRSSENYAAARPKNLIADGAK